MQNNDQAIQGVVLGLDVGDVRIGVARAHSLARLPEPLEVIDRSQTDSIQRLKLLAAEYGAVAFIVGMPAHLSGQEGSQAAAVREFAGALQAAIPLPQIFVDEAYTSLDADVYLKEGKWRTWESNDAVAACLILERYFSETAHV
jgi:putative Holliday junction resolvase